MSKPSVEEIYEFMRKRHPTLGLLPLAVIPEKKTYLTPKELTRPNREIIKTVILDKNTEFQNIRIALQEFCGVHRVRIKMVRVKEEVTDYSDKSYDDDDDDDDEEENEHGSRTARRPWRGSSVPIYGDEKIELNFTILNPNYAADAAAYEHKVKCEEDKKLNIKKHNERRMSMIAQNKDLINCAIKEHRDLWIINAKILAGASPEELVNSKIRILEEEINRLKNIKSEITTENND